MASVQIKGVEKYFGGTHVIRGVDIEIEDGQFAVLVGPSGCGKSTLLRMIAGLEEIGVGQILIGGKVVFSLSAHLWRNGLFLCPPLRFVWLWHIL